MNFLRIWGLLCKDQGGGVLLDKSKYIIVPIRADNTVDQSKKYEIMLYDPKIVGKRKNANAGFGLRFAENWELFKVRMIALEYKKAKKNDGNLKKRKATDDI